MENVEDVSCKIFTFHSGEDSSQGFLGCEAVCCYGRITTFQRTLMPPSPGLPNCWYPITTRKTLIWMWMLVKYKSCHTIAKAVG